MVLCVVCVAEGDTSAGGTVVLIDSASPVLIKLQCPLTTGRGDPWSVKPGDILALRNLDLTSRDQGQGVLGGKWHERVEKAKVVNSKTSHRYLVPAYRSLEEWARHADGTRARDFANRRFSAVAAVAPAGAAALPLPPPPSTTIGNATASIVGITCVEGEAAPRLMATLENGRCVFECELGVFLLWKVLDALAGCKQPAIVGCLVSCVARLRILAGGGGKGNAGAEAEAEPEVGEGSEGEGDVATAIASLAVRTPGTATDFWRLVGSACGLARLEFRICFAGPVPVAVDVAVSIGG